jgi:hypothetical protein
MRIFDYPRDEYLLSNRKTVLQWFGGFAKPKNNYMYIYLIIKSSDLPYRRLDIIEYRENVGYENVDALYESAVHDLVYAHTYPMFMKRIDGSEQIVRYNALLID